MKKLVVAAVAAVLMLSGCAHPDQNTYNAKDVGQPTTVEFGTVLQSRKIDIIGENTGVGAGVGAAGGGLLGAAGSGGSVGWTLGSALLGGVAGAVGEQAMNDRTGVEYTITLKNKKTIVVAQNQGKNDQIFGSGAHVMVQTRGSYQRVLSAENLPDVIEKPKSVHIKKQKLSKDLEPDEDDMTDTAK
jgi:outer membrane lipoprotein SlyB